MEYNLNIVPKNTFYIIATYAAGEGSKNDLIHLLSVNKKIRNWMKEFIANPPKNLFKDTLIDVKIDHAIKTTTLVSLYLKFETDEIKNLFQLTVVESKKPLEKKKKKGGGIFCFPTKKSKNKKIQESIPNNLNTLLCNFKDIPLVNIDKKPTQKEFFERIIDISTQKSYPRIPFIHYTFIKRIRKTDLGKQIANEAESIKEIQHFPDRQVKIFCEKFPAHQFSSANDYLQHIIFFGNIIRNTYYIEEFLPKKK